MADDSLFYLIENTMNSLIGDAVNVINEIFSSYEVMPFNLKIDDFLEFALDQFAKRMEKIESFKGSNEELLDKSFSEGLDN